MKIRYFDNAATSWPKPGSVLEAMKDYFLHGGGNPGRSGHGKSIGAGRIVLNARERLANFFNVLDPSRIVFSKNATEALNTALFGLLHRGDHVVTSSMEHNSVMRPLAFLQEHGIEVTTVKADETGLVHPDSLMKAVKKDTKLVVITHASNVTGTINDIGAVGRMCRKRGVLFLVDGAQTAGVVPVDVQRMNIDLFAFSGHKGLLGPQGTGGLYIGIDEKEVGPLMRGGTGSVSDREVQPDFLPDRFESGTLNVVGIAGLAAGVEYLLDMGREKILEHDSRLLEIFLDGFSRIPQIVIYGRQKPLEQTGVLSFKIQGISPSKAGEILDREYGIQTRIGLHCAPSAHKTIGTFPDGTIRLSWGIFATEKDVQYSIRAVKKIAGSA